jgi:hypothetical protein
LDEKTDIESAALGRLEDGAVVATPEGRGEATYFRLIDGLDPSVAFLLELVNLYFGPHIES